MRKLLAVSLFTFTFSLLPLISSAQYSIIHDFTDPSGDYPYGSLTYASGTLYGMAPVGGYFGLGCIFSIDTNGNNYTDVFDFDGTTGAFPQFGWPGNTLTYSGGRLYGMTPVGGNNGFGNIFSINPNGTAYQNLHYFDSLDGAFPFGQPSISGGVIYGLASYGGANGRGCIFSINTTGTNYKVIFSFDSLDGENPFGSLTISGDNLYGMANSGGAYGYGDIFYLKTNGSGFFDLFDFNGLNGWYPVNSLAFSGKTLYGMTFNGGPDSVGNVFRIDTDGNNFRTLINFNITNGAEPFGNVLFAGGTLYGMAGLGGTGNAGTLFSIDTNAANYSDLHDFTASSADGSYPIASVTINNGILYGMTNLGGTQDSGVIFRYNTGHAGLGISEVKGESEKVKVYPNPSNGKFSLICHSEHSEESNSIEVYNVLGEQVYSQSITNSPSFTVDLSNQYNGVYLYRVIANSGNVLGEGKLVIQK